VEANRFGGAKDIGSKPYTPADIRFTQTKHGTTLYAMTLAVPKEPVRIKALAGEKIAGVTMLGSDAKLAWSQEANALVIIPPATLPCDHAIAFRITLREP